jgi:cobalt-zinc-cadmium efflux system outer membrane protein
MWQGLPHTFGKDSIMKRIQKEAPQTRSRQAKWPLVVVAFTASYVALTFAQTTTAQQPVLVQDAVGNGELATPLPPPEPLPPGTLQPQLGLGELEQMAMSANPVIGRAMALVGAAQGNLVQVGLLPNPTVGYDGQQLGSGGRAEQHGILFSQEIVRGGKLRLNRLVAEQELARAQQELAIIQQRVLTDVRIAFYQVLLAQRQIDLTEGLVQISRRGAAAVDALINAQEATRADVLQAQLEIETAQILARNARNRHEAAWHTLRAVVGHPELPEQAMGGDAYALPKDFEFRETLARLQSTSPEIGLAMTEISRARAALDRARVEPVPNLSLQGLVNVVDNGVDGRPDAGVAISLPIPVFNRNQGTILRAQQEISAAERALQQLELGLQARLAPVFERYANARNQVERYRAAILPAAQESLELNRKMYEAGETGFLALLTAQRTFSQTNLNFLQAMQELREAEMEIEGLLLRDSLANTRSQYPT